MLRPSYLENSLIWKNIHPNLTKHMQYHHIKNILKSGNSQDKKVSSCYFSVGIFFRNNSLGYKGFLKHNNLSSWTLRS